ncbi:hypothetical protein DUY34_06845, partial [Campylobacter coli]|nr:hypothetical protein [Campylobacter coli]
IASPFFLSFSNISSLIFFIKDINSTIITCKSFYFTCFFSLKAHVLKNTKENKLRIIIVIFI